jgi:hypothetical protein
VKIVTVIIFAILFGMIASIPNIFIHSIFAKASDTEGKEINTADKLPNTQTHKLSSDNKDKSDNKVSKNEDKVDTAKEKKSDMKHRHHARHLELEGSHNIDKLPKGSGKVVPTQSHESLDAANTADKLSNDRHKNQNHNDGSDDKSNRGHSADESEVKGSNNAKNINSDSRDELLDKVSTSKELLNILTSFKNFIDDDTSVASNTTSPYSGKVNTTPTRSYVVSYSWEPAEKITKEKYSILMLKFTDAFGKIIDSKDIDYNIMIKDNNSNIIFQKQGSSSTGVDLKVINENTFPIGGSAINPAMYNMQVDVNGIDGKLVSEHALLPAVAVVSEKT